MTDDMTKCKDDNLKAHEAWVAWNEAVKAAAAAKTAAEADKENKEL